MEALALQEIRPFEVELKETDISMEIIHSFSTVSEYDDEKWIIDKRYQDRINNEIKLVFEDISNNVRNNVKEYDLYLLLQRLAGSTIYSRHQEIRRFYKYIYQNFGVTIDEKITARMFYDYYHKLEEMQLAQNTKSAKMRYIKDYYEWRGISHIHKILLEYDIPKQTHSKNDNKYIPEEVAEQLDFIFYNRQDIPLAMCVFYWTLRLFPSRVTEVSSMKLDCLEKVSELEYILKIPTFKQEGQYVKGGVRKLGLYKEGILDFYIDLLLEQIDVAQQLQNELKNKEKGFLFACRIHKWEPWKQSYIESSNLCIIRGNTFNRRMKTIIDKNNICNPDGTVANITTHKFRHNGITDRIQSGLFRAIDIMAITNSKSVAMINQAYVHVNNQEMRENIKTINEVITGEESVEFKGRVIPSDRPQLEQRILSKPFAHKIGKIGICSDISKCESSMFECLNCSSFIPDDSSKEYFCEQIDEWKNKLELALECGNSYLIDRARRYIELNEKMIVKIEGEIG